MHYKHRLTLAIISILLFTLLTTWLAQPVQAQTTTTVTANVSWVNGSTPRPDIALQLYRQTTAVPTAEPVPDGLRTLLAGLPQVSWENIDATDGSNLPYKFTLKELHYDKSLAKFVDGPPANYLVLITYTADSLNAFITLTYTSDLIDITATKLWVGGIGPRPDVAFRLYRATVTTAKQPLPDTFIKDLATGAGSVTWTGLEETNENAVPYIYTVAEGIWNVGRTVFSEGPPLDYKDTYSADGLTVTNTFIEPQVTGTKVWAGGPTPRPIIWFKLYRQISGSNVDPIPVPGAPLKELTSGTTTVTWNDITQRDPTNLPYIFSVREVDAQGTDFTPVSYTKNEAGLTVTNTYTIPNTATATFTKVWVNGPSVKPSVWFKLYRKTLVGVEQEVPLTEAPVKAVPSVAPLQVTWTNLQATDLVGNPYTFFVKEGIWIAASQSFTEGNPTNYTKTVSNDGFTITNTYVIPKINIIGTKIWSGGPAVKPNIQIQLYKNGVLLGNPYTLTSGMTSYTWLNLDQTDINGLLLQYTLDEVAVPAYYSKRVSVMTVTNTYTGTLPYTGDSTNNSRWLVLLLGLSALLPLISWIDLKILTRRQG
jgi:hypothetical protein